MSDPVLLVERPFRYHRFSMIARLLLLLVLVPLADLMLLLMVSRVLGFWLTLSIVLVSGGAGIILCRWQLRSLAWRARQVQHVAEAPGRFLSDGLLIFVGAALLITPGLITDAMGISLLIPASRRWHQRRFFAWLMGRYDWMVVTQHHPSDPNIVEGQVVYRASERDPP